MALLQAVKKVVLEPDRGAIEGVAARECWYPRGIWVRDRGGLERPRPAGTYLILLNARRSEPWILRVATAGDGDEYPRVSRRICSAVRSECGVCKRAGLRDWSGSGSWTASMNAILSRTFLVHQPS